MDNIVARIVAAGMTSAIFTYFFVQLVVKPALSRRGDAWWHALATNGLTLLVATAVAFGLVFIMSDEITSRLAVETIFIGVIAAAVATYGHEVVANYGARNIKTQVNIGEMDGNIGEIGDDA